MRKCSQPTLGVKFLQKFSQKVFVFKSKSTHIPPITWLHSLKYCFIRPGGAEEQDFPPSFPLYIYIFGFSSCKDEERAYFLIIHNVSLLVEANFALI